MFDHDQTTCLPAPAGIAAPASPVHILRGPRAPARPAPCDRPANAAARPEGEAAGGVVDPERQLWCAVIIHTLYEASGRVAYAERGEHDDVRRRAVAWFEEADEDFQVVCDLAGFLPAVIRERALRVIRGGRLPRIRISKAG